MKQAQAADYQLRGNQPSYQLVKQAAHYMILSRQWGLGIDTARYCRARSALVADKGDEDGMGLGMEKENRNGEEDIVQGSDMVPIAEVFEVNDPIMSEMLTLHSKNLARKTVDAVIVAARKELDALLDLMNCTSPCQIGCGRWSAAKWESLQPQPSTEKRIEGTIKEWNMMLYDLSACAGESSTSPAFWFVKRGRKAKVGCIVLSSDHLSSEVCAVSGTYVESMFERVMPLCANSD